MGLTPTTASKTTQTPYLMLLLTLYQGGNMTLADQLSKPKPPRVCTYVKQLNIMPEQDRQAVEEFLAKAIKERNEVAKGHTNWSVKHLASVLKENGYDRMTHWVINRHLRQECGCS